MKKTDILTIVGLVAAVVLTIWGMGMGGTNMLIFWDAASVAITVGGSFATVVITVSSEDFKNLPKVFMQSFKYSKESRVDLISRFSGLSKKARREGLLSLEDEISQVEDDYLKKGLQMVVDGIEPEVIKEIMELEIGEMETRHEKGITILQQWAAYAPAFGMIGTLIGLVQMLAALDDPANIASGMAKALITTFYGSVLANIFLVPIANKLSTRSAEESSFREMMIEGVLAIQSGVNPRIIEEKLNTYLTPKERLEYLQNSINASEGVAE
jgi:chemotaxis protein MotA